MKIQCRLCGSESVQEISTEIRNSDGKQGDGSAASIYGSSRTVPLFRAKVFECNDCRVQFLYPTQSEEELKSYYKTEYRKQYTAESIEDFYRKSLPEAKQRVERVREFIRPYNDILEIGCASGFFLSAVRNSVNRAFGCEWDQHYGNFARALGFDIRENPWDFDLEFDAILMFHVLEHIHHPIEFLEKLRPSIKPKGKLILEVPNRMDALIDLYNIQEFKNYYYQSAHLWYFNEKSLNHVLEHAGYSGEIIPVQRYDLSNHMVWLRDKVPGGQGRFDGYFTDRLKAEYEMMLKEKKLTDTLMVIATKRD